MIPLQGKKLSQSKGYVRPKKTITEMLTVGSEEMMEKLKGYEEVPETDICYIPLGSHIRYISFDKKKRREVFRLGGSVIKIAKDYLVLRGAENLEFSVQRYIFNDKGDVIYITRFFKKGKGGSEMPTNKEMEASLQKTFDIIEKQYDIIEKQKQELMMMKKEFNKMQQQKKK